MSQASVTASPSISNMQESAPYTNPADGSKITINSTIASATNATTGDTVSFYPKTQSYAAILKSNREKIVGLGNGAIAVAFDGNEVVVDKNNQVVTRAKDGRESKLGDVNDPRVQAQIDGLLNAQAVSDLANLHANNGSLGRLPWIVQEFAPSTQQALVDVQAKAQIASEATGNAPTAADFANASPQDIAAYNASEQQLNTIQNQAVADSASFGQKAMSVGMATPPIDTVPPPSATPLIPTPAPTDPTTATPPASPTDSSGT